MMVASLEPRMADRLPEVRGRIAQRVRLADTMWFRVGGPAEILFEPADAADLAAFLHGRPREVPVSILGVGSNVLVRDGGIAGVVVRLGRAFAEIACSGADVPRGRRRDGCHCRARLPRRRHWRPRVPERYSGHHRRRLADERGAYGGEIADVIVGATVLDPSGTSHDIGADTLGYGYRSCAVPPGWIFVAAHLRGRKEPRAAISARMAEIAALAPGNPAGAIAHRWQHFQEPAGRRGLDADRPGRMPGGCASGAARVSDQHANFLINTGGASAGDLESLGEEVRRRSRSAPAPCWSGRSNVSARRPGEAAMVKSVAVLMGGISREREVSLVSGKTVVEALRRGGLRGRHA